MSPVEGDEGEVAGSMAGRAKCDEPALEGARAHAGAMAIEEKAIANVQTVDPESGRGIHTVMKYEPRVIYSGAQSGCTGGASVEFPGGWVWTQSLSGMENA